MSRTDDDMALPPGKTCGDCTGWRRCSAFIGSLKPTNTHCDWAPSAFREREAPVSPTLTGASFGSHNVAAESPKTESGIQGRSSEREAHRADDCA